MLEIKYKTTVKVNNDSIYFNNDLFIIKEDSNIVDFLAFPLSCFQRTRKQNIDD